MTGEASWATGALAVSSTQGSSGNGAGALAADTVPAPGQCGHVTAHLLVFQQNQAYNGDVDRVPDAGVMEQSSHLREGRRLSPWAWDTGGHCPTPAPTCTCLHTQGSSQRTQAAHTAVHACAPTCEGAHTPPPPTRGAPRSAPGEKTTPETCSAQNRAGKPSALLKLSQHKASPHMGTSVRFWGAEMAGQASCELASSNSIKKNNIQIGMDKAFTIKS